MKIKEKIKFRITSGEIRLSNSDDVLEKIVLLSQCKNLEIKENRLKLTYSNNIFHIGHQENYNLNGDILKVNFEIINLTKVLSVCILVGLFMYRGNISQYILYATITSVITAAITLIKIRSGIIKKLKNIEPETTTDKTNAPDNMSDTCATRCPACEAMINPFTGKCSDCGLSLTDKSQTSSTKYCSKNGNVTISYGFSPKQQSN